MFPELKRVVSSPGTTWSTNVLQFGGFPFDLPIHHAIPRACVFASEKIQKKITKILGKSEMRDQNVTCTVYVYCAGEVFFALGIGLL